MSKLFSKVLAICALVVTIPLLIIGTSLTCYYSINASIAVDVFVNRASVSENAYAKVNGKTTGFEITKSHLETTTLTATANGYNFEGWFNGTLETYSEALAEVAGDTEQIDFISKENAVELKMADIDNVLAVFSIKEYDVTYSYKRNPSDDQPITDVPTGGQSHYYFGDNLPPRLTTEEISHTFIGWTLLDENNAPIDETKTYNRAEFDTEAPYKLGAIWAPNPKYVVTYTFGDLCVHDDVEVQQYEGYEVALDDASTYNEYVDLAAGERLAWVLEGTNTEVTSVNEAATVVLTKVNVTYRATLTEANAEEMSYNNAKTIEFTKANTTALAAMLTAGNYTTKYSFWKFEGVTFAGTKYTDATELANAIIATSAHTSTTAAVSAEVVKYFTSVNVADVRYKVYIDAGDGTLMEDPTSHVYYGVNQEVPVAYLNFDETSTTLAHDWIYKDVTTLYTDAANNTEATLIGIVVDTNHTIEITANMTINDVIEALYDGGNVSATFNINTLVVAFL